MLSVKDVVVRFGGVVALDEEDAKRAFWTAFRALGAWWAEFPPY